MALSCPGVFRRQRLVVITSQMSEYLLPSASDTDISGGIKDHRTRNWNTLEQLCMQTLVPEGQCDSVPHGSGQSVLHL